MVIDGFKVLRPPDKEVGSDTAKVTRSAIQGSCVMMMIVLLLFLQKQNLANAIYLFGLGTLLFVLC
jgi:hypothetical protein